MMQQKNNKKIEDRESFEARRVSLFVYMQGGNPARGLVIWCCGVEAKV